MRTGSRLSRYLLRNYGHYTFSRKNGDNNLLGGDKKNCSHINAHLKQGNWTNRPFPGHEAFFIYETSFFRGTKASKMQVAPESLAIFFICTKPTQSSLWGPVTKTTQRARKCITSLLKEVEAPWVQAFL